MAPKKLKLGPCELGDPNRVGLTSVTHMRISKQSLALLQRFISAEKNGTNFREAKNKSRFRSFHFTKRTLMYMMYADAR